MNMEKGYRGIALVIGIDNYEEKDYITQLDKAVADANAVAQKLKKLGFKVIEALDVTSHKYDEKKSEFVTDLKLYDLCIVYYAGHGVESNGENVLLTKDSKISTGNYDTLKRYSIILQELVDDLHTKCDACIFIIDACRKPHKKDRDIGPAKIAPVEVPQGCLIAFSTTSGEAAGEGPKDTAHSNYTTALLKHIEEPNLEIERFFKKVRQTLQDITNGKQTSWEYTSLVGDFIINPIQLDDNNPFKYKESAIVDKDWNDNQTDAIIAKFKKSNYSIQKEALKDFVAIENLNPNQLFVVGRNILQAHNGDQRDCTNFIHNISRIYNYSDNSGENHLLNGIFFELYFNSKGLYRGIHLKNQNDNLDWMVELIKDGRFVKSLEFINNCLSQYSDTLVYIPSTKLKSIEVKVIGTNGSNGAFDTYEVNDVLIDGISVFTDVSADSHPRAYTTDTNNEAKFINLISFIYAIPTSLMNLEYTEKPILGTSFSILKKFKIIRPSD